MKAGLLAVFLEERAAANAVRQLRKEQLSRIEAYSPFPSRELDDSLPQTKSKIPAAMLLAGLTGATFAYLFQWWTRSVAYPLNVGGRPDHTPLAFLPITFETAILFAGVAGFLGFFLETGLPRVSLPLFSVPGFERSGLDGFLVAVNHEDQHFDRESCCTILLDCGAKEVVPFGRLSSFGHPSGEEGQS